MVKTIPQILIAARLQLLRALFVALQVSGVALFCAAGNTHAATERYRYRLETGAQNEVCRHMTQVFNTRFKTPWDKGWLKPELIPKIQGRPYDQVFARMPGVEYNKDFVWSMLLSKYPTSPEFNAVKWQETRGRLTTTSSSSDFPILAARLDIDNDGSLDWVVKSSFMEKMTTWEGMGQAWGLNDALSIFTLNDFAPALPIPSKSLILNDDPSKAPRRLDSYISDGLTTYQMRPFIFNGKTYFSAYQALWKYTKNAGHMLLAPPYKLYPNQEHMNILAVLPGGFKRLDVDLVVNANTETVCRIRMIMQK